MARRNAEHDEHGVNPSAKDGEPNGTPEAELELERRRQAKAEREKSEEAATGMSDHGKRGRPIDDQPNGDEESPEAEMFPQGAVPGDHKLTLKNIVPAGKGRKTEAAMSRAAVPLLDGLVRYGEHVELLVTVEAGSVNEVPDLVAEEASDQRVLKGVKDVQSFRVVHVRHAADLLTTDQVLDILEREFALPRTATKVREVFGLDSPQAAAG